jgi:hypothetical protein
VKESVDRRILGAFVCVDAISGKSVPHPMPVTTGPWRVKPNRSGVYVIFNGPGFELQTTQFYPASPWPGPVSFEVTIQDPSRRYLPRRANVKAPLSVPDIPPPPPGSSTNPAALAALQDSTTVFSPQRVSLYPGPAAPIGPNWAAIHVSVTRSGTTPAKGLPWTFLQVIRNSDNVALANGQSDRNGEALLAVPGLSVQPSTSGTGPVTVSSVAVTVKVYFDPGVLDQPTSWVPNPDDIFLNLSNTTLKTDTKTLALSAAQELSLSFAISV